MDGVSLKTMTQTVLPLRNSLSYFLVLVFTPEEKPPFHRGFFCAGRTQTNTKHITTLHYHHAHEPQLQHHLRYRLRVIHQQYQRPHPHHTHPTTTRISPPTTHAPQPTHPTHTNQRTTPHTTYSHPATHAYIRHCYNLYPLFCCSTKAKYTLPYIKE